MKSAPTSPRVAELFEGEFGDGVLVDYEANTSVSKA